VSENLANGVLALAIVGWAAAFFAISMWWSERKIRIFVQDFSAFGGTPRPAVSWSEDTPEDRIEKEIEKIEEIAGERMRRSGGTDVKYDQQTLENGVEFLLSEARERGEQLSIEQATDEAERMLNAEGSEM
jgi:hypothetical protein